MRTATPLLLAFVVPALPAAAEAGPPGWFAEAAASIPDGWVPGRIYRVVDDGRKVFIAVFPAGADHPATPGNAFDAGQVLEVTLKREGEADVIVSASLHARSPEDRLRTGNEDHHAGILQRLYARAEAEPGVVPCQIRGWAASDAGTGTPVRGAPDDGAGIVGRLGPPVWQGLSEAAGIEGLRAEFDITGYVDGWFRIENATPPGAAYGEPLPPNHPPTYGGVGWLRATEVHAGYANTQMPVPRLLQYPHVDAADYQPAEGARGHDGHLDGDGTLMRLHACSANWALTTARDFQRGWWRGTCSNQVTLCN
ncbi:MULTISPECIES: hypothetical protein [Chelatococcus]|uniref:SH3 domain-containing protein n=1 Tax=Chelatococcus caeni TaxID=1348468 RepID=A0A840C4T7_9HYPH|nr:MULTISPECIES: hypothetical protein [Chelatococcus]MBB4019853.1 hypothetical protein [Chelatococcus caeni]